MGRKGTLDPVLVPAVWSYDGGDGGSVGQRGAALHYGSRGGAFRPAGDIGRSGCVASRCGCHPSDAATAECSVQEVGRPNARKIRQLPAWATFEAVGVRGERNNLSRSI